MSYDDFPAKSALKATLCMNWKSELIDLRQNSSHPLPVKNLSFRAKLISFRKLEQTSILVETASSK